MQPGRRTTDVLVLRRGGLGDTLLMLPTLRALRRRHAGATLWFAGVREFAAVLLANGAVDGVLSSEDLALWSLGMARGVAAREGLGRFAHIVSDDPKVAVVASEHTGVQTFDPRPRDTSPLGLQIARQLGLDPVWPDDARLLPPRTVPVAGPVLLAPGSGGRDKCWPRDRWQALADQLAAAGERVGVVVGPVEMERDDPRCWPWPAGTAFVVEPEPTALTVHFTAAAAFVGNDSGPTHLAAMLGVPTVAIFGPSDPSVWAPAGPHVAVVRGERGFADISVAKVAAALQSGVVRAGGC